MRGGDQREDRGYGGSRDAGRGASGGVRRDDRGGHSPQRDDRGGYRGARDGQDRGDRGGYGARAYDRGDRAGARAYDRGDRAGARAYDRGDRGPRQDDRGPRRDGDDRRPTRPPQAVRESGPEIPEDVEFSMLDREVRARLRTLSKDNAWAVGRHLVMAGRLIDEDPELAYEHAQAAVRHGGRVDVVREAAGLAAYRTGRFAEALRELRTVRRLNGSSEHLAVMADCERGLGRPERAIALAASPEAEDLDVTTRAELAMVVSGARLDMGDPDAAIAALSGIGSGPVRTLLAARVVAARADALRAAGRTAEAEEAEATVPAALLAQVQGTDEDEDVVVFDLDEDEDGLADDAEAADDASDALGTADAADGPDEPAADATDAAEPAVEPDAAQPADEPDAADAADEPDAADAADEPDAADASDEPEAATAAEPDETPAPEPGET
ncbi:hypothetical protein MHY85_20755, partial [Cellulomonas sp. ACRRI]|uniref:hypothetical protein n=1 Tax=Cellulomonas sp. ACRRI TaxID=2918188 RepID=UPI001EF1E7CF